MNNNINVAVGGPINADYPKVYKTKFLKPGIPFSLQVTEPNTKYVIKHNFVLDGDVTIPENSILEFDGGSISGNNHSVLYNNTLIQGKFKVTNYIASGTLANNELNIVYYGAVDNSNTGNDDSYQAIQNAIHAGQRQQKTVIVPKGYFYVGTTITLSNDYTRTFKIKGEGRRFSILSYTGNSGFLFNITDLSGNNYTVQDFYIGSMTLINVGDGGNKAIHIYRADWSKIEDIIFRGFRRDIEADHFWSSIIEYCQFREHTLGYQCNCIYLGSQCNNLTIRQCMMGVPVEADLTYGYGTNISIEEGLSNIGIEDCCIEHGTGISIGGAFPEGNGYMTNVNIINTYFEWIDGNAIIITHFNGTKYPIKNVVILGCYFNAIEGSTNEAIVMGDVENLSIINCDFTRWKDYCIVNNSEARNVHIINCSRDLALSLIKRRHCTHNIIDKGNYQPLKYALADIKTPAYTSDYLTDDNKGLMVWDTTNEKPVFYKGSDTWVDATGTPV